MSKVGLQYYAVPQPPAPYVNLTASAAGAGGPGIRIPAQVDTGAFKTVIPASLVASLGLLQVRELPVEGLGGTPVLLPTFLVEIAIDGLAVITVEVLASPGEPVVLLGRDVLNRYEISLNGPGLILTITEP